MRVKPEVYQGGLLSVIGEPAGSYEWGWERASALVPTSSVEKREWAKVRANPNPRLNHGGLLSVIGEPAGSYEWGLGAGLGAGLDSLCRTEGQHVYYSTKVSVTTRHVPRG